MKAGRKPTTNQRGYIEVCHGLNSNNWLVTKDTTGHMEIVNRDSGKVRVLNK